MPELVLKLGDNEIGRYVFEKDIMSIGRAKDNDVVVENLSVSRNHARIRFHNGKYVLTDLNSANGTFVNGDRQTKVELSNGDTIQIGKHSLVFVNQKLTEEQLIAEQLGQDRTIMVNTVMKPMLQVTNGRLAGTEFVITKFETKVGKGSDCDLILSEDWLMPSVLALILRRGDEVFEIHDRGKLVRTKVNGENVDQPRILKYGDRVEFGSTICVFERASEARVPSGPRPNMEDSAYQSGLLTDDQEDRPLGGLNPSVSQAARPLDPTSPTVLPEEDLGSMDPAELGPIRDEVLKGFGDDEPLAVSAEVPSDPNTADELPGGSALGLSPVMAAMAAAGGDAQRTPLPDSPTSGSQMMSGQGSLPVGGDGGAWRRQEFSPLPEGVDPKEVSMWESMLDNKSAAVRKQALRQLKKLTDRDYDL